MLTRLNKAGNTKRKVKTFGRDLQFMVKSGPLNNMQPAAPSGGIDFVWDTGAMVTVCGRDVADRLGITTGGYNSQLGELHGVGAGVILVENYKNCCISRCAILYLGREKRNSRRRSRLYYNG